MALDDFENSVGIVAGVDNDGLVRFRISHDVAIALQHANREDFVNEVRGAQHEKQYSIRAYGFGGAGFSLHGLDCARAKSKPRRLKPAPLETFSRSFPNS